MSSILYTIYYQVTCAELGLAASFDWRRFCTLPILCLQIRIIYLNQLRLACRDPSPLVSSITTNLSSPKAALRVNFPALLFSLRLCKTRPTVTQSGFTSPFDRALIYQTELSDSILLRLKHNKTNLSPFWQYESGALSFEEDNCIHTGSENLLASRVYSLIHSESEKTDSTLIRFAQNKNWT